MSKYNKLWVALSGAVTQAIAQGALHGTVATWAALVIGAVTAAGVFAVPNTPG